MNDVKVCPSLAFDDKWSCWSIESAMFKIRPRKFSTMNLIACCWSGLGEHQFRCRIPLAWMNIFRKNYHRITVWYHGYSVLLKWHGGKPFLEISETHAYVEAHMRMLRHRVGNVESAATQILNPGVKSVSIRYKGVARVTLNKRRISAKTLNVTVRSVTTEIEVPWFSSKIFVG